MWYGVEARRSQRRAFYCKCMCFTGEIQIQQCLTFAHMDTSITIRISKETKEALEAAAAKEGRSLSNYVRRLLEKKTSTTS